MIYIGVIGGRLCTSELADLAYRTGEAIARNNAVLVSGGMGGIMSHACQGASEAGGVTIGILSGEDREGGNPYLTYSIPTGLGEARNSIVVRSCHGLIAIGGNFGTLSEIAFACLMKKPIAGLYTWRIKFPEGDEEILPTTDSPEEAVRMILKKLNHG